MYILQVQLRDFMFVSTQSSKFCGVCVCVCVESAPPNLEEFCSLDRKEVGGARLKDTNMAHLVVSGKGLGNLV